MMEIKNKEQERAEQRKLIEELEKEEAERLAASEEEDCERIPVWNIEIWSKKQAGKLFTDNRRKASAELSLLLMPKGDLRTHPPSDSFTIEIPYEKAVELVKFLGMNKSVPQADGSGYGSNLYGPDAWSKEFRGKIDWLEEV